MFMNLEIKPKVGDLVVRANGPHFNDHACGYCIESEETFFTIRYFFDDQDCFSYWYDANYDLEMSIISGT